jgi:copper chaperone
MTQLKFITNIKCGGCIATVKPFLDSLSGVKSWSVDTSTPDKILTVEVDTASPDSIQKAIEAAGYKISRV